MVMLIRIDLDAGEYTMSVGIFLYVFFNNVL